VCGLGVEEDRLGHGRRLILGDDDAAVAGELEVNLGQRAISGLRGGMQRVRLSVGVRERVRVGIQQLARVSLLGHRVEAGRRGRRMWRTRAFAAAEELADHVFDGAHASMNGVSAGAGRAAVDSLAGSDRARGW
jgi:hypothetical protein